MNWELLVKIIREEATPAEQAAFGNWLESAVENRNTYEAVKARYHTIEQIIAKDTVQEEWEKVMPRLASPAPVAPANRWYWLRYAAAAAVVVLIGVSAAWFLRESQPPASVVTPQLVTIQATRQEKKMVVLPDSSVIWLHYNASVQYDLHTFNKTSRQLQLTGEAFFDVMPAVNKPFTVQTSHLKITVLGTSFHIMTGAGDVEEVTVATGKVNVHGTHIHADVLPLQKLTYHPEIGVAVIGSSTLANATALKDNQLIFYKDNAGSMTAKIEQWYHRKVVVQGDFHHKVALTGSITDNGIREVLNGLGYQAGFTYKMTTDSIFIYPE
ncbi:FecR family protein [Chitinophaga arvensicola]|uniref:Ferric-dicitrate binding protein FerR, regulates iron transport through sigma-19 n=1 Tax=Chitinophaga arvensicola TaxID=29529 RepID=A0A1I0QXW3_9BACT|nr:FecR family protein [Chitinophaga arvensicola]SEW32425.1 ferric-dicitrate binding protein FerR, regulates iron transport through sigma-19 [Chitinophaga arvensicola]